VPGTFEYALSHGEKHQIILHAEVWGSVGEQQTLAPAIKQLEEPRIYGEYRIRYLHCRYEIQKSKPGI